MRRFTRARRSADTTARRRIVLGATSSQSLIFLKGFPDFLDEHGWEVHVVSSPGPQLDAFRVNPRVHVHQIRMARDPAPMRDLTSFGEWTRLLRRVKPDVVLSGTPKAATLSMLAARLTRVPFRVYHVLGLRFETTRGPVRWALMLSERITCALATRILSISPSLTEALLAAGITDPGKVDFLYPGSSNGIDIERFSPSPQLDRRAAKLRAQLGITKDEFVIGYVGRIHPDKGLDTLVAAANLLASRHRASTEIKPVRLLFVGPLDSSGYDPTPLARVRLTKVGAVDDTRPFYRIMDVLCLPTLREGFPNVPLEAAALGVPVITTTATGARDSIRPGTTGILVSPSNPQELADALTHIAVDPVRSASMGLCGIVWARLFARPQIWRTQLDYLCSMIRGVSVGLEGE